MTNNFVPFALAEIGKEEIEEVTGVLLSGWMTTGPKTTEFEKDFAEFIGAPFAFAVNSATAGLHFVLEALEIDPWEKFS